MQRKMEIGFLSSVKSDKEIVSILWSCCKAEEVVFAEAIL